MARRAQQSKVALLDKPARKKGKTATEDSVHAAIYDAVMDHRLPPGVKLTESAFSEFFGVSRTVIRKALFRLAQQNVVELRPNRGAVVASPTPEETHAVFDARRLVEHQLIRTVAENAGKSDIQHLKDLTRREQAAHKNGDNRALVRLSGEFHVRLAEFAGNPVLTDFLTSLVSRTSLIIALYEAPGVPACATHDHWELIELIEAGDARGAADSMRRHLTEIERRLDLSTSEGPLDLNEVFGST
jgi:DNA-binding GntR family transcriptional regulator